MIEMMRKIRASALSAVVVTLLFAMVLTAVPVYADDAAPGDAEAVSGVPITKVTAKGKTSLVISWAKVTGASGYDVFLSKCSSAKDSRKPSKRVKTIKGSGTLKWTKKGLKQKTAYKTYVKAWVKKDGKKKYVAASPLMHVFTSGGTKKYTNAKSITVNEAEADLAPDQTFQITAKVNKLKSSKKLMPKKHAAKVRYLSTDKKVATVSSKGVVTAKDRGTCNIYVYAHNGVRKSVKVTVTVESSALPVGLEQYIEASDNCEVGSTEIKKLADSLTMGLSSDTERANALFEYVRDQISYTFYYDTKYGAIGTLNQGTGNCVDQSHLLIALLRTAGIPARYCHGQVKFSSGSVLGHVWVECTTKTSGYTSWVKLDPTSQRNSYDTITNWDEDSLVLYDRYVDLPF